MVAIRGSLVDKGPMVRRVRKLLECVDEAAIQATSNDRAGRPIHAHNQGEADRTLVAGDLEDIEARLRQVREAFPDLQVEESPHLVQARAWLGKVDNPPSAPGEEAWTDRHRGATE